MGGIGSKRMNIIEFSSELQEYSTKVADTQFGFIELRPNGILLLINKQLQNYCWPIPFNELYFDGDVDLKIGTKVHYLVFENGKIHGAPILNRIENH